jgi:hypothetical protein
MATVIFSGNPQVEAMAVIATLQLWLNEQEPKAEPKAASAHFVHDTNGLSRVVVTVEPEV